MVKVVEAFSGIGSQAKALENINVKYDIAHTIDWDINAIIAYDILHNGKQNLKEMKIKDKDQLVSILKEYTLSSNGKEPLTEKSLRRFNVQTLQSLLFAIERSDNLVNVTDVTADDLPDDIDIFTYSFPCQDLSISGFWHGNKGGIDREANNRSSMLWEIERILLDFEDKNKPMPKMLLMENVISIRSARHIDNFNEWQENLKRLGYENKVYDLFAQDFGVPQLRKRTFMISVYIGQDANKKSYVKNYFEEHNLEDKNYIRTLNRSKKDLRDYLRTDYSNPTYRLEAIKSIPNDTESRRKIKRENPHIIDENGIDLGYVRTITTKQDRHPNSGIIVDQISTIAPENKSDFRYLSPRECFLLMGFDESDFDKLIENNFMVNNARYFFTSEKLIKMAGNSIVVDILEEVFKQMLDIKKRLEENF